jgi:M6 family metalloprotease-like protein
MRRPLCLLLVASMVLSFFTFLPSAVRAPHEPATSAPHGPHYMEPNPEVYSTMPFKQNPPMLGSTGRTRAPLTNDIVVLLVEFVGKTHSTSHTPAFVDNLMNGMSHGNLRSYYSDVSYGAYTVMATVGGNTWFQSVHQMDYYGTDSTTGYDDYNGPIYDLVTEAVHLADASVDFSNFDHDGDGVVDHLLIVHAGNGQEDSGTLSDIWSHRWAVVSPNLMVDGVQIYGYTMVSENSPIGVIAHEYGHDLGLPDLYNTATGGSGAGIWDLMATGSWAGPALSRGTNPAHLGAWCKAKLGWAQVVEVTTARYGVDILQAETDKVVYKLPIQESGGTEYFLVENREKTGYDSNMPGAGLLIWHIDESQHDNTNDAHRLVDLEEEDGASGDSPTDAGDPWTNNLDGFTPDSNPNSNGYGNVRTGWKVYSISAAGATMTADISKVVDDDVAVIDVANTKSVVVGAALYISVEVANLGGRNQTGIPVNVTIFRGAHDQAHVVYSNTRSYSVVAKTYINLTWSYTPPSVGRYFIEVSAILARDQFPENNYKLTHFNAMNAYFFDDVEAGNKGWTATPAGELHQWQIVTVGGYAGDAMSPNSSWRFGYFGGLNSIAPHYTLESSDIAFQAGQLYLSFFHHYALAVTGDTRANNTDFAYVNVSFNGGAWFQVPGGRFNNTEAEWIFFFANLTTSASTSGTMRVRFECTAGHMPVDGGWWIDDIFVSPYPFGKAVGILPVVTGQTVEPGDKASFLFKVVNLGDSEDKFSFVVTSEASWIVGLSTSASPPEIPELVLIKLKPDREAVATLIVQTPGDAPRGTVETFSLTVRSNSTHSIKDSFDAQVTIHDPLGLARLSKYFVLIVVVFILLIAIAVMIDHRKKRRGIR